MVLGYQMSYSFWLNECFIAFLGIDDFSGINMFMHN